MSGGNIHGFAAPAEAYMVAEKAGVGWSRVILPEPIRTQLRKFQGPTLETDFAPATPSGSFAAKALAEILDASAWSDAVLIAGDLGHNSETAILLEKFVTKYRGQITITKDAVDYFTKSPASIQSRENTLLVLSIAQLQKLAISLKFKTPITFSMDLLKLIEALHEFTSQFQILFITKHLDNLIVAVSGQVSTTKTDKDLEDNWRVETATKASVWCLQNPSAPFEAITSSLVMG